MSKNNIPIREEDLQAWVDGRLPQDKIRLIEAWLENHPEEARKWRRYRDQADALRQAYAPVLEEPIPAALTSSLQQRRHRRAWGQGLMRAASVLAVFGLGAAAGILWEQQGGGRVTSTDWAQPALFAHRTYAVEVRHPVEVTAAERDHLLTWLSKRMQRPMEAPNLSSLGFELLGGRLLPGENLPSCQFMYEDTAGRRITLYVTEGGGNQDTAFRLMQQDGLTAFYWIDQHLGYALVGETDRTEMEQAARLVHAVFSREG